MFTCGNCEGTHKKVATARACHQGETFDCDWQIEIQTEDGPQAEECGATAWNTDRGYECENGHAHVSAEVRHREGWDYAHDSYEAGLLAREGVAAVAMNGGAIDIDPAAFHHA